MKAPAPISLWAVVIIQTRSTWINWHTIRRTRAEAVAAYVDFWDRTEHRGEVMRDRNKRWRTERVRVECVHSENSNA